jgi:endonuclease/exonuclease/phosphatase family metal-dependent hydrolase
MQNNNYGFTIATYNIFDGRNSGKTITNILELIQNGASVICLQEVRQAYRNVEFTKLLAERLPKHISSKYFLEDNARWFDYGLGILWDTTVFSSPNFHQLSLPEQDHLTFWNKLFYWMLGLEPKIIRRGALIGTFKCGAQKVRISNLHLDFQGGSEHRTNQLKYLRDFLALQAAVDQEIICGDFNTLGLFHKKNKILALEEQMEDGFQSVLSKPYSSSIVQQLDYIFIKNLKLRRAGLFKQKGSDHYPLLAEVSL